MHLLSIFSFKAVRTLWIIACFLILLMVLDRVASLVILKIVEQSSFRYSRLYSGKIKKDSIIILGSSRSVVSFYQPQMVKRLNMPVENMGYNGLNPAVQEILLADIVNAGIQPKLIILEISNVAQHTDIEWVSVLEPFQLFSKGLWGAYEGTQSENALKCSISRLYCLNNEVLLRVMYYLLKSDQSWTQTRQITPAEIAAIPTSKTGHNLNTENIIYYRRMLELTKNKNIPVRLVLAPYFPKMADRMQLDHFLCMLESKLSHPIESYIDAVDDPTAYADSIHLNRKGAHLFLSKLMNDGYFSDFDLRYHPIDRSQCLKNRAQE